MSEKRSEPGKGDKCRVFVVGKADERADGIVPAFGKISAGCGPNIREDFADSGWPVVVKVKLNVTPSDLAQHLRDLADGLEGESEWSISETFPLAEQIVGALESIAARNGHDQARVTEIRDKVIDLMMPRDGRAETLPA